jgi:hypothetical protein
MLSARKTRVVAVLVLVTATGARGSEARQAEEPASCEADVNLLILSNTHKTDAGQSVLSSGEEVCCHQPHRG